MSLLCWCLSQHWDGDSWEGESRAWGQDSPLRGTWSHFGSRPTPGLELCLSAPLQSINRFQL